MFPQELFGDLDVAVGDFVGIQFVRLFMPPGFHQIRTIKRATDGDFALVPATNGADFAADPGAMAARLARVADQAFHDGTLGNSIVASGLSLRRFRCDRGVSVLWPQMPTAPAGT